MAIRKVVGIPVPPEIENDDEKAEAFCIGWLYATSNGSVDAAVKLEQKLGVSLRETDNADDLRPGQYHPVVNAYWWGYYSAIGRMAAASTTPTNPIREPRDNDLVAIHERMERNPSFIPMWAWVDEGEPADL